MKNLPKFYIHKHQSSNLHYDFRIEIGRELKSWAIPKGPSLNPASKRMALLVKDHIPEKGPFEGVIPKGKSGADPVMLWDFGEYLFVPEPRTKREKPPSDTEEAFQRGALKFELRGHKCKGRWGLIYIKGRGNTWLLVKDNDEYADREIELTEARPYSVKTFRTMEQIKESH